MVTYWPEFGAAGKELITLDDVSNGRITLGIGAGGNGFDAATLRGADEEPWTPRERADHFGEFLPLLDRLLTEDSVTYEGERYAAYEARNIPGCVQRPRLPFAVAATGPRGLRLAARHGQAWVTTGDPKISATGTPEQSLEAIRGQFDKLGKACADVGRDIDTTRVRRMIDRQVAHMARLLDDPTLPTTDLSSLEALTYGAAFNTSAEDLNVYWTAVNDAGQVVGGVVAGLGLLSDSLYLYHLWILIEIEQASLDQHQHADGDETLRSREDDLQRLTAPRRT